MTVQTLSHYDLSLFLLRLRQLTVAGCAPDQSLTTIAAATPDPAFKGILQQAAAGLKNGQNLAEALCPKAGHPFPPLVCNSLQAASSGQNSLEPVLSGVVASGTPATRYGQMELLIALLVPVVVLLLIFMFVVPVFGKMFADFGSELPGPTKLIIAASEFVLRYSFVILAAIIWGFWYLIKRLRLMIRTSDRAVTFGVMAACTAQGDSLQEALKLAAVAAENRKLQNGLSSVASMLENGQTFAAALKQSGLISPLAALLLGLDEHLQPPAQLAALADHYQQRARQAVNWQSLAVFMSIFVTVLICAILVISMYLPIFKLAGGG